MQRRLTSHQSKVSKLQLLITCLLPVSKQIIPTLPCMQGLSGVCIQTVFELAGSTGLQEKLKIMNNIFLGAWRHAHAAHAAEADSKAYSDLVLCQAAACFCYNLS